MNQYSYTSLNPGELRLLMLLPAAGEGTTIRCKLQHVLLYSAPQYDAISYKWAATPGKALVETDTGSLWISKTLEEALRAMRWKREPRMLWADGICVNQGSTEEVQGQLDLMEKIYAHSRSTLAWLGPSTDQSTTAIEVLHSLALLAIQRKAFAGMDEDNFCAHVLHKRPKDSSVFVCEEDHFLQEVAGRRSLVLLHRNPELSDDEIFRFEDSRLWCEIDGLFFNSYFERTWIQREAAKASYLQLHRGCHIFSWPLFRWAFAGRSLLFFHKPQAEERFAGALQNVIDARERWRTPEHRTTLAGALVGLSYSKETNKHDHIYAAYAMSKFSIPWLEGPAEDRKMKIEELMIRTACTCIEERGDLYHLGQWCVTSRKKMSLPTWAPDFTSGICELAVEYASRATGELIRGSYNICGEVLCLEAHLLDTVAWSHEIGDCGDLENIVKIVRGFERVLRRQGTGGLFEEYIVSQESWTASKSSETARHELLQQLSEAEVVLKSSSWCSENVLAHLRLGCEAIQRRPEHSFKYQQLAIEALWLLLNPSSRVRSRSAAARGEHLFLAWLYLASMTGAAKGHISCADLPKAFGGLIFALLPTSLLPLDHSVTTWVTKFIADHVFQTKISSYETECVFITKRGFIGRSAAGETAEGDIVAFLGGGWTPYVLDRRGSSFGIKSFAYIEGLAELAVKPAGWKVERIALR